MTSASDDYLFVYGTLRPDPNGRAHELLKAHADRVGPGRTLGILYDLGTYPGAVKSIGARVFVRGEVYRLRDADRALKVLDRYEGLEDRRPRSGEFRRSRAVVELDAGKTVRAWIYLYNRPTAGLARIRSGDYLAPRSK